MIILSSTTGLSTDEISDLGIYAQWQFGDKIPTKETKLCESDIFAVKDVQDRGLYYTRPEDATGIIVLSSDKLTVVAAWRNPEHKGPWQVYGEQEAKTTAYYLVGDTDIVFVGWV